MENQEQILREYEVAFLVRDEASAQDASARVAQYGTITSQGAVKRLAFAYPVKKETSGFFGFLRLQALPEAITRLEKDFEMAQPILRVLVTRISDKKEGAAEEGRPKRVMRTAPRAEAAPGGALTNEALEKKIEEILQ